MKITDGRVSSLVLDKMMSLDALYMYRHLFSDDDDILIDFVFAYISKAKILDFDINCFDELYDEFKLFIDEKRYIVRTIGYITGCHLRDEFECPPFKLYPPHKQEYIECFLSITRNYLLRRGYPLSITPDLAIASLFPMNEKPNNLWSARQREKILKTCLSDGATIK